MKNDALSTLSLRLGRALLAITWLGLGCGSDPAATRPPLTEDPWDGGAVSIVGSPDDDGSITTVDPPPAEAGANVQDASISDDAALSSDVAMDGACKTPLSSGHLAIEELMIASVSGTGDYGEWIEVQSKRTCAVNLRGLHGDCPVGAKVHTFDVTEDMWLPPHGRFLVADSDGAATNHDLPGPIVIWTGAPGDVLRNKGGTITLRMNDVLIDSITYPALKIATGASLSFPSTCTADARPDWTRWQISTSSWFPGFAGTPNAPNDDVPCK